jgi:hypothetical protein
MRYVFAAWMLAIAACGGGSEGVCKTSCDAAAAPHDMAMTPGVCAMFCDKLVTCGVTTADECRLDCPYDGGIPDLGDACEQSNIACQLSCASIDACTNISSCIQSCPSCP